MRSGIVSVCACLSFRHVWFDHLHAPHAMTTVAPPANFRGPSQRDLLVDEVADRLRMESDIIGERWRRLQSAVVRVQNHKDAFRRECAMLAEDQEQLEQDRIEFEKEVAVKWPAAALPEEHQMDRFKLNVGGARMEATAEVLSRDRFSILAALCSDRPPLNPDADGCFFFDRDGVLFEQVLNFLRDGVLPDDEETLRGMYNEAAFFRLGLLKKHVEAKFQELAKKRQDIYERSIQGEAAAPNMQPLMAPMGSPQRQPMMVSPQRRMSIGASVAMGGYDGTQMYGGMPGAPPMNRSMQAAMAGEYMGRLDAQRAMGMNVTMPLPNQMPSAGGYGGSNGQGGFQPLTRHSFMPAMQPHLDPRTNTLPDPFGFTRTY